MVCDMPCMSYMALYVISMHLVNSSSRSGTSSQHWKLNVSAGKVEPAKASSNNTDSRNNTTTNNASSASQSLPRQQRPENSSFDDISSGSTGSNHDEFYEERMMQILHSKVSSGQEWIVLAPDTENEGCVSCEKCSQDISNPGSCSSHSQSKEETSHGSRTESTKPLKSQKPLTCGKKVNYTAYDHLKGISDRHLHSHIPEPDVAVVFQSIGKSAEVDINDLEQKLRKTRKDVEKAGPEQRENAAQVYNLIGNFWRIKGNTQISIECFRKALSISPNNSNVLLNLARVLLNLQYLEDAILLAWRSLKLHDDDTGSSKFLQHFTLGQALRALAERGEGSELHPQHARQAAAHFLHALELNPDFAPAKLHLRELEARGFSGEGIGVDWLSGKQAGTEEDHGNLPSVAQLSLFVILSLVIGLLSGVFISLDTNFARGEGEECGSGDSRQGFKSSSSVSAQLQSSQQRHFNRAMAMRSMKMGINRKLCGRSRKNNNNGF
ncbi:tetratricopeptide repeat protein 17-like [Plakobranchus ocellatus]|uniref:Tetratricopeptide repeat protein 17-like n=1 Tax=Plakobranchus ocellatus TaxID=259542 RepID=A0AAV4C3Y0_9GAST|nr:tetratricopeptide repeat protein 17-like [Plakobranchus ocellatus]